MQILLHIVKRLLLNAVGVFLLPILAEREVVMLQMLINTVSTDRIFQAVVIFVMIDTFFGVLRAIRDHSFNSNCGIDGAIRKIAMICSCLFCIVIDSLASINLIGFIPAEAMVYITKYIGLTTIGVSDFFGILFICYEIISVLKNMTLCGLPVKKVYIIIRKFLSKYTDEMPDNDEIDGTKSEVAPVQQKEV